MDGLAGGRKESGGIRSLPVLSHRTGFPIQQESGARREDDYREQESAAA